jgi:hypothetical protein
LKLLLLLQVLTHIVAAAVPDNWPHWAALADIYMMHALSIPPFGHSKGGKPSAGAVEFVAKTKVYKARNHLLEYLLYTVILQLTDGMTQTLLKEHQHLKDYAANECAQWCRDPENAKYIHAGIRKTAKIADPQVQHDSDSEGCSTDLGSPTARPAGNAVYLHGFATLHSDTCHLIVAGGLNRRSDEARTQRRIARMEASGVNAAKALGKGVRAVPRPSSTRTCREASPEQESTPPTPEYELRRRRTIQCNMQVMRNLGLDSAAAALSSKGKEARARGAGRK